MKVLVLSDVHANITALEAVWKQEHDADLVICAGDLVDYGTHPREVIDWMIDRQVPVVKGNHDRLVVEAFDQPSTEEPLLWRDVNAQQLSRRHVDYLRSLPETLVLELDGETYGMAHAFDEKYAIPRSVEALVRFSQERFSRTLHRFILGHTHRREMMRLADDLFYLNPGSVSYRRTDEAWRGAHYAVIQDGNISLRAVPYPDDHLHALVMASAVCEKEKRPTYRWWGPESANPSSPAKG